MGDALLSWRPQNIIFIGLVLLGYVLVFAIVGQLYRRISGGGSDAATSF